MLDRTGGDCNAFEVKGVAWVTVIILYCVGLMHCVRMCVWHEFIYLCLCKQAWAVEDFLDGVPACLHTLVNALSLSLSVYIYIYTLICTHSILSTEGRMWGCK